MSFFKNLLVGASLVVAAVAQQRLQFAPIPSPISAGQTNVDIAWIGGDGSSPITITLRNGPAGNLANVSTLADNVSGLGNNFYWNVPSDLPGGEYALFIAQGSEYNYSPRFGVTGSSSSSSSSSTTASASSTASASGTDSASSTITGVSGIGLLPPVSASPSLSSVLSSLNGTLSSLVSNLTSSMPITAAGASGAAASGAAGTGIPMSRNTTLSSATLTAPTSTDTATATSLTSSTGTSAGSVSSGSVGSSTASSTRSSSSAASSSGAISGMGSSLALVMGAFGAIVCLN